jgi:hypothetical protein
MGELRKETGNARTEGMVGKLTEIKKILRILRENGVSEYKNGDFYVKLSDRAYLSKPIMDLKLESKTNSNNVLDEEDLYYSGG